jgi:thiamine pyrophosphate-dependent acetolactate synthase large subunit-like protein
MMRTEDVLKLFQQYRGDAIVIPGRGGRHWVEISDQPERDAPLGDPAMGGHASFALGLALARPNDKVVLFDSEGDVLMGLGALTTIAEMRPANLYHFMLDNGCYATTGGQPVPNAEHVRYELLAEGSGYPVAYTFDHIEELAGHMEAILDQSGPVFVGLKIEPEIVNEPIGQRRRWQTRSREQVASDLRQVLGPRDSG